MAKKKLKKYPKKPKASSSNAVKENYLRRVKEVDAENRAIQAENKRGEQLTKQIAGIGKVRVHHAAPKKRKHSAKKHAGKARKHSRRKR